MSKVSFVLALALLSLGPACRSPLAELRPPPGQSLALAVPATQVEDHSRALNQLRAVAAGEANTPEARKAALAGHGRYLDDAFRERAAAAWIGLDPAAPYRLELTLTTVGEVRTRYIVYAILSGVAWGVGTGLATHNPQLALGLGAYELVEESLFWIAGSRLFGRFSAPVVLEARLYPKEPGKPLWQESYFVIWGDRRKQAGKADRAAQIQASLDQALDHLFRDLAALPRP